MPSLYDVPSQLSPTRGTSAGSRPGRVRILGLSAAAATPFLVVAGLIGGATGLPAALAVVGLLLWWCFGGCLETARRARETAGLHSVIAEGLGRAAGVTAATVATVAYTALLAGLFGAVGAVGSSVLAGWVGLELPWWFVAGIGWAITGVLGLLRIGFIAALLSMVAFAETAAIGYFAVRTFKDPDAGTVTAGSLVPTTLSVTNIEGILVLAAIGFVGVETALMLSQEVRQRHRTTKAASRTALLLVAAMGAIVSCTVTMAAGPARIPVESVPDRLATLTGDLGGNAVGIGRALALAGLLAAAVAFHSVASRYLFALGSDRALPSKLGSSSPRSGGPRVASLVQSLITAAVLTWFTMTGADPVAELSLPAITFGISGVLFLLTAASLGATVGAARQPETPARGRQLVPGAIAAAALFTIAVLALRNPPALPDSEVAAGVTRMTLVIYGIAAAVGLVLWLIRRTVMRSGYSAKETGSTSYPTREADWGQTREADQGRTRGADRGQTRDADWGQTREANWDQTREAGRGRTRGAGRGRTQEADWLG